MSIERRQQNAEHPHRSRRLGLTVVLLTTLSAVGCTAALPATSPSPQPSATASPAGATPFPSGDFTELDAGTYLVTSFAVPFEITIPDGWTGADDWLLVKGRDDPAAVFLNFLTPRFVPPSACDWYRTLAEVDPSVEGFATALAEQTSTVTTDPVPVTLGGYDGVEFGLAVEGVARMIDCDQARICIHSELSGDCTRWYTNVDRRETYLVLDLDGERAVVTVGQDAGAPADWVAEAEAILDSITFVTEP